jgi:hypothetical protein
MEDGSQIIGVFNFGEEPANFDFRSRLPGLAKPKSVRDLWRQKDIKPGNFEIPCHGTLLLRVWR